jgi:purine nucleosidase
VLIDTDTDAGVDDACAMWWLLTHPDVGVARILGTSSNRPLDLVLRAIRNVLAATGRTDVPLAASVRVPAEPFATLKSGNRFHGADGLGGTARNLDPAGFRECSRRRSSPRPPRSRPRC